MDDDWARPIDDGKVAQVLVEYLGSRRGAVRYQGPGSNRNYSFAAGENSRFQYVLTADVGRFDGHTDFAIHHDRAIDPEQLERDAQQRQIADLSAKLDGLGRRAVDKRKDGPRPVGRRRRDTNDHHAFHLYKHCPDGWKLRALADRFLTEPSVAPEKAMSKRLITFAKRYPELAATQTCSYCQAGECEPPPVEKKFRR